MTPYHQITSEERYTLSVLRRQGLTPAAIARVMGRHRSTISREVRRNLCASDGQSYRSRFGHWEGDTVLGDRQGGACILTLVERKSGFTAIGKLARRTGAEVNRRARTLIRKQPRPVRTVTVDNGTEFHSYKALEQLVAARFYFATPHHAWERGTNENTNGLLRQYLPKRTSMEHLTQQDCDRIATKLNRLPRKRLGFRTPEECYVP